MNIQFLTADITISKREFVVITLLNSGTLAWFFLLQLYIWDILTYITVETFWVEIGYILFFGFGILSAIVGSLIVGKMNRGKFLWLWLTLGVLSTALLIIFQGTLFCIISSILLGLSLGLGLPSSMAFLADNTTIEERGRVSGITILETFILAFSAMAIIRILDSDIIITILLLILLRSVSIIAMILDKDQPKMMKEKVKSFKPDYKEFAYYVFPWMMFVIVASFAWNLIPQEFESARLTGSVFRYGFMALFGIVWGIVADRVGRKQPVIIGLIILGISFGLLSFEMSKDSVLIYMMASGIAWSSFLSIYFVIPADLSISGSREKYYAFITIAPLIILFSFSIIDPIIFEGLSISSFSQVLSIILFISLIPIMRAKETLEESKKRRRRLKEHTERVGKLIKKFEETENNQLDNNN